MRLARTTFIALFCLEVAASSAAAQKQRVTLDQGTLEGAIDPPSGVLVFRGIPYAVPPIGDLRWSAPRPPTRWGLVRDATRLGRNCTQGQMYSDIDPFAAGVSEDCLNLNVWTTGSTGARRPVLVWIHGGGFRAGFGGEERHDGGPLAKKGAVVVTLNYRLGPFGFLAHPALALDAPHNSAGNYGLLDQIAALQWVKRNIAKFGGDPTRVTIFGESAGAMSIGALIGSPLARGLFHRAILESGSGLGWNVQRRDSAEAEGMRLATALGITGTDAAAARSLRALSADSLLAASNAANGIGGRRPTIDGWVLPRPLDSALVSGQANVVPIIIGSNADEGDAVFGAPARALARLVSAGRTRAYLYQYTRVGDDSANHKRGAYHSSEITFVFGRPAPILANAGRTTYDATLANAMSDYWVAFATTGDPNGPPTAGKHPRWPVYDAVTDASIELGPVISAKHGLRRAVYDSLDVIARKSGDIRPR